MQKNVAGQKWIVFAFDETDNTPVTGDAANITGNLRLDGGAANAIDDTNPTELEDGYYIFDITQAESNADNILISPESSTANVQVIGVPGAVWTRPPNFEAFAIDGSGRIDVGEWLGTAVPTPTVGGRPVVSEGYGGGEVFVDTVGGAAGTVSHVNGTIENPSNSIANAKIIADVLNIKTFRILLGSSITLATSFDNYIFNAHHATIALNGQSVSNTIFNGGVITGNDDGSNVNPTQYCECFFGSNTLGQFVFTYCYVSGTITLAEAGTYRMHDCKSAVAGASTPTLDFGAGLAASDVNMRNYSGGIEIEYMGEGAGTYNLSLSGRGQIVINANCSATSNVMLRGNFNVTDNTNGAVTVTRDDDSANIITLVTGVPQMKYNGPHGPGVYIDSGAGNTNTVEGTDGTFDNPVSTFVAAKTIADALGTNGVKVYYIIGNSDLTLAATHEDWTFIGFGEVSSNVVNLGSQDLDRSCFMNLTLEGTQGGTGRISARHCALQDPGVGDTTLHIFAVNCGIIDRIQVDTSGDNVFKDCVSLVAGPSAPVIQATGASGTISVRNFSGGIEFESLSASHNLSVETDGQVIFNANCNVNATVALRGMMTITDNTAGMNNLSTRAVFETILDDDSEVYDRTTESLQVLGDRMTAVKAVTDLIPDAGAMDDLADILADTVLIDKWIKNKMVFSGNDIILYDDDDSTPLLTWTLSQGTLGVSGPYDRAKST